MRTLILIFFVALYLLFFIPVYLILEMIGKTNKKLKDKISFVLVANVLRFILHKIAGANVTVIGKENIPKDEAVLFVSNHRSHFDILVSYANLPNPTGFVAKKELGKIPMLKQWMINLNCILLDRQDPKEGLKSILQGIENIKSGISMFICPEGTRHKDGKMGTFKEGSLKIAQKSGCRIIPVLFINTENLFENSNNKVTKANVLIEFGEPIDLKDLDAEDQKHSVTYVQKKIIAMLEEHADFQ